MLKADGEVCEVFYVKIRGVSVNTNVWDTFKINK